MKNITKILLTGFIAGCGVANIFAMKVDETKEVKVPEVAAATAAAPNTTEFHMLIPITEDLDILSASTDEVLRNILARHVGSYFAESYLNNVFNQGILLKKLELAINRLKELRFVKHRFAIFLTHQEMINILIEANIVRYANQYNPDIGETLLHRALRIGKFDLAKFLIEAEVNINSPTRAPIDPKILRRFPVGTTSLHMASRAGRPELVRLLTERGADVTAATSSPYRHLDNLTALDYARNADCTKIIAILEGAYTASKSPIPSDENSDIPNFSLG